MSNLAIIIPAYKDRFFERMLESFACQTCKDFTIYVGDDNSDGDFKTIVDKYKSQLDIVYHRFSENYGGVDLVAQWTRCVNLSTKEKWLWLFSDDDFVDPFCVEAFYKSVETNKYDIYHFNTNIVNEDDRITYRCKAFPKVINARTFYLKKAFGKLDSFVVEYIFSRNIYNKVEGFQIFDLAWGSDIATWIKMAQERGIYTIEDGTVYWRCSNYNITPSTNQKVVVRKLKAFMQFLLWTNSFFHSRSVVILNKIIFLKNLFYYSRHLLEPDMNNILDISSKNHIIARYNIGFIKCLYRLYLSSCRGIRFK